MQTCIFQLLQRAEQGDCEQDDGRHPPEHEHSRGELLQRRLPHCRHSNIRQIGNGLIDEYIQAPFYPEFAVNNTYGIKSVNDTVYSYAKFAANMRGGCLDQVAGCRSLNRTTFSDFVVCQEAQDMCRDNVESPYYSYGGRGVSCSPCGTATLEHVLTASLIFRPMTSGILAEIPLHLGFSRITLTSGSCKMR